MKIQKHYEDSDLSFLEEELREFFKFGKKTQEGEFSDFGVKVPVFINEFWTAKQRAGNSLHEISYRACFKPELPRFFIERLTSPGDVVYDPFMGRGTTLLEAALCGRIPFGCDINPLSQILLMPRLRPPKIREVSRRLDEIDFSSSREELSQDLLVFYHPDTLGQIQSLRNYFIRRESSGELDGVDAWIRMVATGRLSGHSPGFFSVYTLPPNQAVSLKSQKKINERRNQIPPKRDIKKLIFKKTTSLLKSLENEVLPLFRNAKEEKQRKNLFEASKRALILTKSSESTSEIFDSSVNLVVTSPPFLNVVDYKTDNWLRCWFNNIDASSVPIWQLKHQSKWILAMTDVFCELRRVLTPGGYIVFEVGEVLKGKLQMENLVIPASSAAGLKAELILINDQEFTKTANCWGIENQKKGTNTNRVVLLRK